MRVLKTLEIGNEATYASLGIFMMGIVDTEEGCAGFIAEGVAGSGDVRDTGDVCSATVEPAEVAEAPEDQACLIYFTV